MAGTADPRIEDLLRRAGFGARPDELIHCGNLTIRLMPDSLGEPIKTSVSQDRAPADLVDRQFAATRPNHFWASDFTDVDDCRQSEMVPRPAVSTAGRE